MQDNKESVLASKLANRGIRLTRQRRILLDIIENASDHLQASDLLRLAREEDDRIDRATVYRTLQLLKKHGLIEELDLLHLDGAEHHYEVVSGAGHAHIGCTVCGKVVEMETSLLSELEGEIRRRTGFEVSSVRIEVAAICPKCRSKK